MNTWAIFFLCLRGHIHATAWEKTNHVRPRARAGSRLFVAPQGRKKEKAEKTLKGCAADIVTTGGNVARICTAHTHTQNYIALCVSVCVCVCVCRYSGHTHAHAHTHCCWIKLMPTNKARSVPPPTTTTRQVGHRECDVCGGSGHGYGGQTGGKHKHAKLVFLFFFSDGRQFCRQTQRSKGCFRGLYK